MRKLSGIMYPGDDGSEPEHIRLAKAQDYADEVDANAERVAMKSYRPREGTEQSDGAFWFIIGLLVLSATLPWILI